MLLDQEVKKEEPKGKKAVLFALIFFSILLVLVIVMMIAIGGNQKKALTISVNGSDVAIDNELIISNENGVTYMSISKLAKLIGYDYLTGKYKQYNEDNTNTNGYLENENQIIQFEADNNKIYKTVPNSDLDYEEYELTNKIIKTNNLLYIALEDINIGLNVSCVFSEADNKIVINTIENLTEKYKTSLATETNNEFTAISEEYNNEKAISHNMLVVSNEKQKWGVISSVDYSPIIGNKYTSLEFIEDAGVFIASDEGKYGIISKEPSIKPIIDLNYEEIKVINYSPLFYQVKLAGKYGVIDGEGKFILNNDYDSMGYKAQKNMEQSVLVIEEFGKDKQNLLIVCKQGKYGLVDLKTGKPVGDCILEKVYSKNESGETKYYIQLQEKEFELNAYIEKLNTTTINVGQ